MPQETNPKWQERFFPGGWAVLVFLALVAVIIFMFVALF